MLSTVAGPGHLVSSCSFTRSPVQVYPARINREDPPPPSPKYKVIMRDSRVPSGNADNDVLKLLLHVLKFIE